MARENDQMAFHALADYQNHVIGSCNGEQSALGDGAVVDFREFGCHLGNVRATLLHDLLVRRVTLDPGHGYGPEANRERFKNLAVMLTTAGPF